MAIDPLCGDRATEASSRRVTEDNKIRITECKTWKTYWARNTSILLGGTKCP